MSGLRPPPGVGTLAQDGVVYAALLPAGPIVVLDGIAALIWEEACSGERATIAERVAAATDASPETIRADVDAFVADLVRRGLLRQRDGVLPPERTTHPTPPTAATPAPPTSARGHEARDSRFHRPS